MYLKYLAPPSSREPSSFLGVLGGSGVAAPPACSQNSQYQETCCLLTSPARMCFSHTVFNSPT